MTEFYPAQVEVEIAETIRRTEKSPGVRADLERKRDEAKRALSVAQAHALLNATGTIPEREAQVVLAVQDEQAAFDEAEVAYRYAENQVKTLDRNLSGWQTILKSLLVTYGAAGTGER